MQDLGRACTWVFTQFLCHPSLPMQTEFLEMWRFFGSVLYFKACLKLRSIPGPSIPTAPAHVNMRRPRSLVKRNSWSHAELLNEIRYLLHLLQMFKALNSPQCPKFASRHQGVAYRSYIQAASKTLQNWRAEEHHQLLVCSRIFRLEGLGCRPGWAERDFVAMRAAMSDS